MVVGIFLAVFFATGFTCPILYFFKIPCPTCGVTRALLALLRLDFKAYLQYNFMAVFLVSAVWLLIHVRLFRRRKIIYGYCAAVLLVNTAVYIFRMIL